MDENKIVARSRKQEELQNSACLPVKALMMSHCRASTECFGQRRNRLNRNATPAVPAGKPMTHCFTF